MLGDDARRGAERTGGAERFGRGTDEDVDGWSRDVVQFCETTACASDGTEREGLVEDEAELVLIFEFDL